MVWAGGQEAIPARFEARLKGSGELLEWDVAVAMERPIKAVTTVIRGVPRGRISGSGQSFFDPGDDEVLLGYPFSGGDLFGPGSARGLTTPFAVVEASPGRYFYLSSLDSRVRTKRFYFQPGESSYRVEAVHEVEGWIEQKEVQVPRWRVRTSDVSRGSRAAPLRAYREGLPDPPLGEP